MAGAIAKKETEVVEVPPFNWRCQDELIFGGADKCRRPLTDAWMAIPLDEDNPGRFARLCVACAKKASEQQRIAPIEQFMQVQSSGFGKVALGIVIGAALTLMVKGMLF